MKVRYEYCCEGIGHTLPLPHLAQAGFAFLSGYGGEIICCGRQAVRLCEAAKADCLVLGQVVWQTDTSAEAAKARAEEQLSAAMSSMVTVGNMEAEEAEARKREEKRRAKEEAACLVRPPPV